MAASRRSANPLDTSRLMAACNAIGNEAGDEEGFVSVRSLLARFRADLIMRPLLVEAMIATVDAPTTSSEGKASWVVLVDSERYAVKDHAISNESIRNPLPVRFRNTIAHELVHSLAFRATEFGIELNRCADSKFSASEYVAEVERNTERLSPLILLPERTLRRLIESKAQPFTANELRVICKEYGVSRYVLINRLKMLRDRSDLSELREHIALTNLAVGLGEWTQQGEGVLKKWPLFINFQNSIVPAPLIRLATEDRLPGASLVADENFVLSGGDALSAELTCDAALPGMKADDKMQVRVTVEPTQRRPGSEFLFVMSKVLAAEMQRGARLHPPIRHVRT